MHVWEKTDNSLSEKETRDERDEEDTEKRKRSYKLYMIVNSFDFCE